MAKVKKVKKVKAKTNVKGMVTANAELNKERANIIAKLESLNIGYDDKMELAELQALLDKATAKADSEVEQEAPTRAEVEKAPGVTLGVGTIQDHGDRIFAIEQKLKIR